MNINYKETQIDFLSQVSAKGQPPAPARYMAAQVSLSLENLVILAIAAIMVVIFSFSLGIERGKFMATLESQAVSSGEKQASAVTEAKPQKPEGKAKDAVVADDKDMKASGSSASSLAKVVVPLSRPAADAKTVSGACW